MDDIYDEVIAPTMRECDVNPMSDKTSRCRGRTIGSQVTAPTRTPSDSNGGRDSYMEVAFAPAHKLALSQKKVRDSAEAAQMRTFGWPLFVFMTGDWRPVPSSEGIIARSQPTSTGQLERPPRRRDNQPLT